MNYIDITYYRDTYNSAGEIIDADITRYIQRAEEWIDDMTQNRIINQGFDNLSTFQQGMVKKAAAAYVEFTSVNGELEIGGSNNAESFSIGSVSLSNTSNTNVQSGITSYRAYRFLVRSGLAYRGIG